MAEVFDPTDVPAVTPAEMAVVLEAVVVAERARVFFYGVGDGDRAAVEAAFWSRFEGAPSRGGAALLRLWSLIDVLGARRLRRKVLHEGYRFLEEAVASAADQRLNIDWGFNPQRLLWAIAQRGAEAARSQTCARVHRNASVQPTPGRQPLRLAAKLEPRLGARSPDSVRY